MDELKWPQLSLINLFGHWPSSGMKGSAQRLLSIGVLLLTVALLVAESYSTKEYFKEDINTALVNLNEMLSGSQCFVTTLVFIFYRQRLKTVLRLVKELAERVTMEVGGPAMEELKKRRRNLRRAHLIFFWSFVIIFHWALRPLLHLAIYGETSLIVHSWVPFDNQTISGFFGNFFLQLIPCTSFCLGINMFLSIFVGICELILGLFAVLKYRLENLEYGKPETEIELRMCVRHHEDLLKICRNFDKFTAVPLVAHCFLTVLVLCVILYELTIVETTTTERVMNVVEEAQQELLFLATYCWYVNEITLQCGKVLHPGYVANWYNGSKKEKGILLTIMTRSMVPQYFGIVITIDILTFINVLKAAFSYYNFLGAVSKNTMTE